MKSLWLLTKKNLRLLIRSKGSALIIIFAPLLLMLILGFSFNSSEQFGLNIGIYAPSMSADVTEFKNLLEKEEFSVTIFEENLDLCLESMKTSKIHTCISLPESLQVSGNEQKEITFYVDQSRINLVWMVQETVQSKFDLQSQQITQELTQDILSKLDSTKSTVTEKIGTLNAAKEKTTSASSATATAKSSLIAIDVVVSATNYNDSTASAIDKDIKDSKDLVKKAKSAVSSSSLDDAEKDAIKEDLSSAESKLTSSIKALSGNGTNEGGILSVLSKELADTRSKLQIAGNAITKSNTNLDTVKASLDESSKSIDSVLESLNGIKSNIESVKVTEANTITSPLVTKIESVNEKGTYLNYLFSSLIVLVVMFSSLVLGTSLVMMEKNSPAFFRNFFLPIRKITFIASIYLTNLIVNILQIVVILGISLIFLRESANSLPAVALILLIATSVFTFMGMVIGYLFNSEETGILATISFGSLHLLFSGLILPLESVNIVLRKIAFLNPFVLAEKMVREVFLFNAPLQSVMTDLGILIGYAVIFFVLILIIETILHDHIVHRYLRHHHHAHRQNDKKNKNEA